MTCPRCHGFVIEQYGETRCLICGWRDNPPVSTIDLGENGRQKGGAQLPGTLSARSRQGMKAGGG